MSRPHDERPGRHRPGRAVPGPRPGGARPPADRPNGRHATRRPDGPGNPGIPDPRPEPSRHRGRPEQPPIGSRPLGDADPDVPTIGLHATPPVTPPRPVPSGDPGPVPPARGPRPDRSGADHDRPWGDSAAGNGWFHDGEHETRTGRIPSTGRRRAPARPPVDRTFDVPGRTTPAHDPTPDPRPATEAEPAGDVAAADLTSPGTAPFDTGALDATAFDTTALDTTLFEEPRLDATPTQYIPPQRITPPADAPPENGATAVPAPRPVPDTRSGRADLAPVPVDVPTAPGPDPTAPGRPAGSGATVVAPAPVPAPRLSTPPPAAEPAAPSSTRPDRKRLLGVDVARGVALFGIIAVHALVEGNDDGAPATNYLIFGGRSAALFALLAGVALAFMTGRARVRRDSATPVAAMIATRAAVLLALGLALGWTDPEIAAVILPYYAVMFLLAIPLLFLPTGALAGLTVVLAGAVPVLSHLVRPSLPIPTLDNPHVVDLFTDPLGLLSELTLTGAYPAVPWLAYLGAGIVVGRLRLSSLRTAVALFAGGAAAAGAATAVSWWLLTRAGGYDAIIAATPLEQLESAPTVVDFVNGLPDGVTPTTTWWWLATVAPHSGTPLDLVQTIGSALAVLGAALLLAGVTRPLPERLLGYVLRPVAAAGSMTLTLYTASLLFMNSPLDVFDALEGYLWQIGAALVIGTAWRRAVGRGPLEAATSMIAHAARDRVRAHRRVDRGRRPARRGARTSRSR